MRKYIRKTTQKWGNSDPIAARLRVKWTHRAKYGLLPAEWAGEDGFKQFVSDIPTPPSESHILVQTDKTDLKSLSWLTPAEAGVLRRKDPNKLARGTRRVPSSSPRSSKVFVPFVSNPAIISRFWSHVDKRDALSCWLWQLSLHFNGYGQFFIPWAGQTRAKRKVGAHAFSLYISLGAPPDGKPCALHTCDNPGCVNPAHLFWGSDGDNNKDKMVKGRDRYHGRLSPADVVEIRERWAGKHGNNRAARAEVRAFAAAKSVGTRHVWSIAHGFIRRQPRNVTGDL